MPVRLRACSHGGGEPRESEVPHLPDVRKPGLHMQPRGAGVRFKNAIAWLLSTYINKEFRNNCPDEHHPTPPPAFTWRKLTPAKRVTHLG